MTNPTSLRIVDLRDRALRAVRPLAPIGVMPTENLYATVNVTLPDGSIGVVGALDVATACVVWLRGEDCHVQVRQGRRVDLWHVSQLS